MAEVKYQKLRVRSIKPCETYKLIPIDEYIRVMESGDTEIDREFLCFEENYIPLVPFIPYDFTVVDLGCYMAAQSYHFTNKAGYVGVDVYDAKRINGYNPPLRFKPWNAVHMTESIVDFMKNHLQFFDIHKTYFIMSAVPDPEGKLATYVLNNVEHAYIAYPGKKTQVKGINSDIIRKAAYEYKLEHCPERIRQDVDYKEETKAS